MPLSLTLFFLAFVLSFSSAQAMPHMADKSSSHTTAEDRFITMDTDKNDAITWQEFSHAHPHINKNAFVSIDTNHNDVLDMDEWKDFFSFHSSRQATDTERMMRAMKEGAMNGEGETGKEGSAMPLVMPPTRNALPLVTPSAGK